MDDRRRWPRYPVSWLARVSSLSDGPAIVTRAVDASLHGLRLAVEPGGAPTLLRPGEHYRIELSDSTRAWMFVRTGEVQHLSDQGAGFELAESLYLGGAGGKSQR